MTDCSGSLSLRTFHSLYLYVDTYVHALYLPVWWVHGEFVWSHELSHPRSATVLHSHAFSYRWWHNQILDFPFVDNTGSMLAKIHHTRWFLFPAEESESSLEGYPINMSCNLRNRSHCKEVQKIQTSNVQNSIFLKFEKSGHGFFFSCSHFLVRQNYILYQHLQTQIYTHVKMKKPADTLNINIIHITKLYFTMYIKNWSVKHKITFEKLTFKSMNELE